MKEFVPAFRNVVCAARNLAAPRVPLYEHLISDTVMERILGREFAPCILSIRPTGRNISAITAASLQLWGDGSIVNMGLKNADGSVRYIVGLRKNIRDKIGKQAGDTVQVTIMERE